MADSGAEVQRLQAIVVDGGPATAVANATRQRSREDSVRGGDAAVHFGPHQDLQEATMAADGKNLPVVVSRRPRVTCRAHGCSNDRVRCKHVAVNREGNELVRHLTQAQSRLAVAQPKISQSPQAGPHR